MNVLEAHGLGKRYGSVWALRECTLSLPAGRLVALVGPNGAGKSTLLNIAVGLTGPTTGDVSVLGGIRPGSPAALDGIGFVAQDMPLYRTFSVADMVHLTRNLNRGFDVGDAQRRLAELGISGRQTVGKLSGGQKAQLALTLALARHPRLLVLDEPTAPLDPIARHDFMSAVLAAMVEDDVSVLLSSHALAELERVADYLVLISHGIVRLDGAVDELTSEHRLITGPADQPAEPGWDVVSASAAGAQQHLLVRLTTPTEPEPASWHARPVGLEELAMAYLQAPIPAPATVVGVR